jgi:hypothetical protein
MAPPNLTRRNRIAHMAVNSNNYRKKTAQNRLRMLKSMGTGTRKLTGFRWADETGRPLTNTQFFNWRTREMINKNKNNFNINTGLEPITRNIRHYRPATRINKSTLKYNKEISKLYAQISGMTNSYNEMMEIAYKSRLPDKAKYNLMMKLKRNFYNLNDPVSYTHYRNTHPKQTYYINQPRTFRSINME